MKSFLLFCLLVLAQFFLAQPAHAQSGGAGVYFCDGCAFPGDGNYPDAAGDLLAFIKATVNPNIANWEKDKFVTICNSSACVVFVYQFGSFLQAGGEFPNLFSRQDYENPEDVPSEGGNYGGGVGVGAYDDPGSNDPYANCLIIPGYRAGTSTGGGATVYVTYPSTLSCPAT